ncbi:MAG: hypothetical protein AB7K41_14730 [Bdellovibrionales bacterium]
MIERMQQLEARGIDCRACVGECCTSRCNSMLITKVEAEDILSYLKRENLWNDEWTARLRACVREFRLDVELPSFGSRRNLRRTYTCPFYQAGPRGCLLSREAKPYGCLGFNAVVAGAKGLSDGCQSDQNLLAQQASLHSEQPPLKAPIPVAILDLLGPN